MFLLENLCVVDLCLKGLLDHSSATLKHSFWFSENSIICMAFAIGERFIELVTAYEKVYSAEPASQITKVGPLDSYHVACSLSLLLFKECPTLILGFYILCPTKEWHLGVASEIRKHLFILGLAFIICWVIDIIHPLFQRLEDQFL